MKGSTKRRGIPRVVEPFFLRWDDRIGKVGSRPMSTAKTVILSLIVVSRLYAQNTGDKPSPSNDWPMFRGQPSLTGIAKGKLPDRLHTTWTFEAPDAVGSSAAIVVGTVYVGCDDAHLYALDLHTGKLRWRYKAGDRIRSSPSVIDGRVFFGDDEGTMHAVDAGSGQPLWTFQTGDQIISSVNHRDGWIVFGSYDGFVYCLKAEDGALVWKFETAGRVHGTPGLTSNHVVAAGCDEYLHVLQWRDGKAVRAVSLDSVSGVSAALAGPYVYVATYGGHITGVNWQTGEVLWDYHDAERSFPYLSSAAVTDRIVIVGGRDKQVRALGLKTGELRWTFSTKGRVDSSPIVVDRRGFVGSSDGVLYGLDLTTGREVWRFETGSPIIASPATVDGFLIIGNEVGVIYAFGSPKRLR